MVTDMRFPRLFINLVFMFGLFCSLSFILAACGEADSVSEEIVTSLPYSGALYYREGRYGKDKQSVYLKLELPSLTSKRLIEDLGFAYSTSMDGAQSLRVDSSRTVIHSYYESGSLNKSIDVDYQVSSAARFSPDNRYIAFLFSNNYAQYYLGVISAEGGAVVVLAIDSDGVSKRGPSGVDWTPNGGVMFTGYGRIYHLPSIESDSFEVIRSFGSNIETYDLRVSPDGSKVAFLLDDFDAWYKEGNLYVMNADGTSLRQVAVRDGLYAFTHPAWSPDGKYIGAIYGENRGDSSGARGCGSIWLFNADLPEVAYINEETDDADIEGAEKIDTADYEVHGMCPTRGLDWR